MKISVISSCARTSVSLPTVACVLDCPHFVKFTATVRAGVEPLNNSITHEPAGAAIRMPFSHMLRGFLSFDFRFLKSLLFNCTERRAFCSLPAVQTLFLGPGHQTGCSTPFRSCCNCNCACRSLSLEVLHNVGYF